MSDHNTRQAGHDPLSGRDSDLLPTPSLGEYEFEDFIERLLSAQRFLPDPARRVVRVERWGRRGDTQHGIDLEGTFSDGKTAAWQCKRLDKLTAAVVIAVVAATTYKADEYYLTFAGEASSLARVEMAKHPQWQILDRRGLGRMLNDLPLHLRRQVLDDTWGRDVRRRFLSIPGEDSFIGIYQVLRSRMNDEDMLNDLGDMVGRNVESRLIMRALDRSGEWPPVVVVSGVGGVGKSRLLSASLAAWQDQNPTLPVVWLAPGRSVDQDALSELPLSPTVIVVDDAHRDPAQLVPLLSFCKSNPSAQLVLGSRGIGIEPIRSEILRGGYRASQILEIPISDLTIAEGRQLVASASSGLNLQFGLSEFLAKQAMDAPYVATLTINLLRKGELQGPLALDSGLRETVMARYEEHLTGSIGDISSTIVRRLLATIAALGTVDTSNLELREKLCEFVRLPLIDFLRLQKELIDRGVLLIRNSKVRIVQELLADQILEAQVVVGTAATGFADELWNVFSAANQQALLTNLASLDWRIARQGGPPVVAGIWKVIEARVTDSGYEGLYSFLGEADSLVYSQPARLLELLDLVSLRLLLLGESEVTPVLETTPSWRSRMGLPEIGQRHVEERLPSLYASCAENDPALLEGALGPILGLARTDARPPHQHPKHPQRVVVDRLGSLGALPDDSFPQRIVAWVAQAALEPDHPKDVVTPLFALSPLLEKEGYSSSMQEKGALSMVPYLVSPGWAAPVRDGVRSILAEQIRNHGSHRASTAIKLLREALSEPRGMFGNQVTYEEIAAWEEDDLATLICFREAAGPGSTSTVRRLVRHAVSGTAERGHVLRVRYAALEILTELDQREEDDVVEILLGGADLSFALESQRGKTLLPFVAWSAVVGAETDEKKEAHENSAYSRIEARVSGLITQVSDKLWPVGESVAPGITVLIDALRSVRDTVGHQSASAIVLFGPLARLRPELPRRLVSHVIDAADTILDESLPALLNSWLQTDADSAVAFFESLNGHPVAVRRAIGRGFQDYGWAMTITDLAPVLELGVEDSDADIRQTFLASFNIVDDPRGVSARLLAADSRPETVSNVLLWGFRNGSDEWPSCVSVEEADAILQLADATNWQGWPVEHAVASIAESYPRLVLDRMESLLRSGKELPEDAGDQSTHLQHRPLEIAQWFADRANLLDATSDSYSLTIVSTVFGRGLQADVGVALVPQLAGLDVHALARAVHLLARTGAWAASHPDLARKVLETARAHSGDATTATLSALRASMKPLMWTTINGHSDSIAKMHSDLLAFGESELDLDLRAAYKTAAEEIGSRMKTIRERDNEDEWDE